MANYNKKQVQWSQEYNKKAYDDIKVRVPKGKRDIYKALAESKGKSLNAFIVDYLESQLN